MKAAAVIIEYWFYVWFFTYILFICPINLERATVQIRMQRHRDIYLIQVIGINKLLVMYVILSFVIFLP